MQMLLWHQAQLSDLTEGDLMTTLNDDAYVTQQYRLS